MMTPRATSCVTSATPLRFSDPLPDRVDVAIIGGGVIGIFTALYLARMGVRALVLEKGRIAGEQSSRNWGWIRQHGRDEAELPIMMQSLQLWHDIDQELEGGCGVKATGTTYLARTQAEYRTYKEWITLAAKHGLEAFLLSAQEVNAIFDGKSAVPWVGGAHTPSDARGEPWVAVPNVAVLAHRTGVAIRENCAVRRLKVSKGRVTGVITEDGTVTCDRAVLAAGAWSSIFARIHGISLPQLSVKATVAQTAPMDAFFSGNAVDDMLAIRRRADNGFTLALPDYHEFYLGPDALRFAKIYRPLIRESWRDIKVRLGAPCGFPDSWAAPSGWRKGAVLPFEAMRVLEPRPRPSCVAAMVARFGQQFPTLKRPEILTSWAGMIDVMPDVVPVVDRVDSLDGFVIATGMSGHGFGIGPGFGRVVARMVAGKKAEHDLSRFRLSRFSDGRRLTLGPAL